MSKSLVSWMAGAALALAAYAGEVRADSQYGAIAYSAPSKSLYFKIECDTQEECETGVLENCRNKAGDPEACEMLLLFRDTCGAFAGASNGAYGTGWGNNQATARRFAVATCKEFGGEDCASESWACSNGAFHIE